MSHLKAACIILTPDPGATELYLVERNPKLKFFGGYYAFPGGKLDADDNTNAIVLANADTMEQETIPYLITAVRETFEECGVLLTRGNENLANEDLKEYRKELLADKLDFGEFLRQEDQVIDVSDFRHVCNLLTPEFAPVRYDTQFFLAQVPKNQTIEIWPGELTQGRFYLAAEALSAWSNGRMAIVPPVLFMLKLLRNQNLTTFVEAVRNEAEAYANGALHEVYFTPGIQVLTLITRTLAPATHTNTFIVGENQLYIIDPATDDKHEQQRLWNYLDGLRQAGCEFKGILLTHHHSDHIGAVEECQQRYDLPLMAHRKTVEKLPGFSFDRTLEDGDELDLGHAPDGAPGWTLKVFHTPGHASGHLSFRESRYGAVIAGDVVSTLSTIVISPPDGHMATYMETLSLLESITMGTIYPSHGPAVRVGKEVVRYFIKHRKERENKLLEVLSRQPQAVRELVKLAYDDVDSAAWPLAEHSLTAELIKLIEERKCVEEAGRYRLS